MSTIAEIKAAIDLLSPREYCELMTLLHPYDDDDWDREMKTDAAAGKFDALNSRASVAAEDSRCIPLEQIFDE